LNLKVSIIVPNYNHASFLKERIDSILNQTYQNFELILLDDCSTDDSVSILNTFKNHPKVSQFIINEETSGSPFKQWQKGIELAKGDYIWIAESDDYCDTSFLEVLVPSLMDESVALAYCASTIIDDLGIVKGRHQWADALDPRRWQSNFKNSGIKEIENYLRYRNTITNASSVIFKLQAAQHIEFPVSMKFCGDWYFWIEILKQGNIVYKQQQLNYFRRHSATTKFVKPFELERLRFKEYIDIIRANSSFLSRLLNYKKYLWILEEWARKNVHFPKNALKKIDLPKELIICSKFHKKLR
jgi:glycosyltransferase involved in cell wall biosynthesis